MLVERPPGRYTFRVIARNILLAAADRGLGSVWFTLYDSEALRRSLQIESNHDIVGVLPLGYPKGDPRPSQRRRVEEKIRYVE